MNAHDFLNLLLPSTGIIVTATPLSSGKGWAHTCHKSIDSAVQHVNTLTFEGKQSYFALATYEKEKVWDATWKNAAGVAVGKNRTRTQANAQFVKSLYLDLDVDILDEAKFTSKKEAIGSLRGLVQRLALPRPMLVDSGGGVHVYWPFGQEVPALDWQRVADKFKTIILHENFKADRVVTADRARVLRALGGFNFRRGAPVKLLAPAPAPTTLAQMEACFDQFISNNSIPDVRARTLPVLSGVQPTAEAEGNLGVTNDPVHFDRVSFACAQIGGQVAVRGAGVGEKLWRAGLGIAKFSDPQAPAYRAISDQHDEYDEALTVHKINNWRTGPTACAHFHAENPATCEACPHWQKITSPAQLGRTVAALPPAVVTIVEADGTEITVIIPDPPAGYVRSVKKGVQFGVEDNDGKTDYVTICPYDFYPVKILRQTGDELQIDERSVWRADLPKLGLFDLDISQSIMAESRRLHALLLSKGIYMPPECVAQTQTYMSAYLRILAEQAERERLYDHLGWSDDHKAFVLGTQVLYADGTSHPHNPSRTIKRVTKNGVAPAGSLDAWKQAINFYNIPGYEGPRFFLYASIGAALFHMNDTGNKGVLLTASGDSGRGKTTCLKACASMWGRPDDMLTNGNKDGTTVNMLYEKIGVYNSLPFFWDDITELPPEVLRSFSLNISQGTGKERMKGSEHSGLMRTWQTMVLSSGNMNTISQIVSSGKEVDPHLMRMVNVEFGLINTGSAAKLVADNFLRQIGQNYGHVGPIVMAFVVANYDRVAKGYIKNIAKVDTLLNSANASAERFWSASVAAAYTGAQILQKLGLIDFPIEDDLKWMVSLLTQQRAIIVEASAEPIDVLSEFLESVVPNTLIVSPKASSNLDNVILHPHGALLVRHDAEEDIIYVARSAITKYCADNKASFNKIESALESSGVIISRNIQKILGSDTKYAKGQTRCWKIDNAKLGGVMRMPVGAATPTGNVTPIRKSGT